MDPFLEKENWQHWCLPIIHGFFAQTRCSSFGWSFSVALIARRSRFYAGTRYRKRGLNVDGQVGNDVETEQLLCDESTRHLAYGHVMSFVQAVCILKQGRGEEAKLMSKNPSGRRKKEEDYKPKDAETAGTSTSGGSLWSAGSYDQTSRQMVGQEPLARPRVLVTGATGLLGREMMKVLDSSWEVCGLCKSRAQPPCVVACDLTQEEAFWQLMEQFRPQVVLHLAAEWRPEVLRQSPEQARQLNVDAAGTVAAACEKFKAWLVHLSADCVFDGTKPPYTVESRPNPLSEYGWQKLHSEQLVRAACPGAAVLRVPLLYGPVESPLDSAITSLYTDLRNGIREVDAWQCCYPTWAGDVAKVLKMMAELHLSGERLQGIYHWQGQRLECSRLKNLLGQMQPTSLHEGLAQCLAPFRAQGPQALGSEAKVEHLEKFPVTRIGRVCDFTVSGQRYQAGSAMNTATVGARQGKGPVQALQPGKDEEGFSLVDTRPVPGKSTGRGRKGIQANYQEGILGQKQKPFYQERITPWNPLLQ
eukprot:Skav226519  [mRNA]  locus=scaffold1773:165900:187543:- [translate_table: standard]